MGGWYRPPQIPSRAGVSYMTRFNTKVPGLTIVELLVSTGVISLLAAILLPAMSAGRQAAKDLECRAQFRDVTQRFINFADDSGVGLRGESQSLDGRFEIEDFQESLYQVDEFGAGPESERTQVDAASSPLMCPASAGALERRAGLPCSAGAIGPAKNVSTGFNKRLETRTREVRGRLFPANAYLSSKILTMPDVPLVFDVDGQQAAERAVLPFYAAPPILTDKWTDIYESGKNWFPSFRHRGRMNVGFIGGHVLSSLHPTEEPWWQWNYQPDS